MKQAGSDRRRVFFTGVALIVSGVLLAIIASGERRASLAAVPVIAGAALCVSGAITRVPGYYLPGMLVLGAGIALSVSYATASTMTHAHLIGLFLVCEATALLLLPVLSRITGWSFILWPFPPAVATAFYGIGMLVAPGGGAFARFLDSSWQGAVALSVAFVVIVFWRRKRL